MSTRHFVYAFLALILSLSTNDSSGEIVGGSSSYNSASSQLNDNYRSPPLPTNKDIGKECKKFINDDGTYGEYGELIKKEILGIRPNQSENRVTLFLDRDPSNIASLCPNFSNMNIDQRLNFWIWSMAAMAKDESGCNANSKSGNAGPKHTGVVVGLFQTPQMEEGRSPSWRGPGCKTPPDYSDVKQQVACAVEILGNHLEGNYRKGPDYKRDGYTPFDDTSYWAVLRPSNRENKKTRDKGTDTLSIIKEFPPCK